MTSQPGRGARMHREFMLNAFFSLHWAVSRVKFHPQRGRERPLLREESMQR